ncbi:magnetosome biogenesis CDF transporter MamM [Magnetofaba australis]|uniref:Cation diffusion facilitator family transporter n=1 Tax=Magnetofaba australis IT-1 TaxID=1434232 RepID=W0LP10_9PROT|nr:magnetosome biogenesis CDF transporter MamM [Magnetofaba australis]AHG23885.1 cation diffusion facilitator family transporter [Magnetofaba australis IT-1]OSM08632.1 putative cation diffusion facilitator family transporter, magnetosome protein [Magnetofaba australis IT-1]
MRYARCVVCYEMIGWIGLMVNLVLSAMKIFVGIISGSHALVADALYSAKDVVTSILIIVGLKISSQPLDEKHPFGHGKVEFLFSLVISIVLLISTGWLLYNVTSVLLEGSHSAPHMIALWTAILSLVVNLFFYGYSKCVATEINSPMVRTLSKHHHADAFSSSAVALGIIGSHYLGMPWLDNVVALGETVHLLYLGGEVFWEAFKGLMDTAGPKEVSRKIHERANSIKGVQIVESIRTRMVGQEIWISLTIGVEPEISISEAKMIAERVEEVLADHIEHVGNVNAHFRCTPGSVPEFDEIKEDMESLLTLGQDPDSPDGEPSSDTKGAHPDPV